MENESFVLNREEYEEEYSEDEGIDYPPDNPDHVATGKNLLRRKGEGVSSGEESGSSDDDDDDGSIVDGMSASRVSNPHRTRSMKKRGNGEVLAGGLTAVTPAASSKHKRSKGSARFADSVGTKTPASRLQKATAAETRLSLGQQQAAAAGNPLSQVAGTPQAASPTPNRRLNYTVSGIRGRIGSLGAAIQDDASILATLEWQSNVRGDSQNIKSFRSQVLAQMDLTCLAYMRDTTPYVQLLHSAFPFHRLGAAPEVMGRDVAFIGDRTERGAPLPVLLKPDQPWQWPSVKVSLDALDFQGHFEAATDEEKLDMWSPQDQSGVKSEKLPRLLLLPLWLVDWLIQAPRTPYDVYRHVIDSTQKTGAGLTASNWKLVTDWCIAAAQKKADGNSVFAMVPESPATACHIFTEWCGWRVNSTLGEPAPPPTPSQPTQQQQQQVGSMESMLQMQMSAVKTIALELGKSVASTMVTASKKATSESHAKDKFGHKYLPFETAIIKGFAAVKKASLIPSIWAKFQTTKDTNIHRQYIMQAMKKWSDLHNMEIDQSIYLSDQTVEDIVKLNFVPGDGVAMYESCDRGVTVLACRPLSAAAKERLKQRERAKKESNATRTFEDSLKLMKTDPVSPPKDFDELRKCTNTYAALLFSLHGEFNDHYDKVYDVALMLKSNTIARRDVNFDRLLCSQIAWAYIEDQRDNFADPMQPNDFRRGKKIKFPQSSLDFITEKIRFQSKFERADYPWQWREWATGSAELVPSQGLLQAPGPPIPAGPSPYPQPQPSPKKVHTGKNPDIHPRIKPVTETMIYKFKKIMFKKILEASAKEYHDLPTIPRLVVNGRNNVCYPWVFGWCQKGDKCSKCALGGHPPSRDIPDEFADNICNMLGQGVAFVALHTNPPRQKDSGGGLE